MEFCPQFRELFRKPQDPLIFHVETDHRSVKHLIEYFGVPHSEVGSIHVNGAEVCFGYKPQSGDWIYVRPLIGPVDVTRTSVLRPVGFRPNQFIVDECVANLTPKLRMLGCDVIADRSWDDQELAEISAREQRILITRDRGLLMRKEVVWGRFLRGRNPTQQIQEVVRFFGLAKLDSALQRCLICNGLLRPVTKDKILDRLEPGTIKFYDEFSQCDQCHRVYWEGSHYNRMRRNLEDFLIS